MPVLLIRLPEVHAQPNNRPSNCPNCGSQILQRWGRVTKPIKNRHDIMAVIYRYRCRDCERTFRHYPEDIDRSSHTRGIRRLAALLWALGLSYREIINILNKYQITLSLTTIWRESQVVTTHLAGAKAKKLRQEFRIDKDYIHKVSNHLGLVLAMDLGDEEYVIIGTLNEYNPASVTSWLRPVIQDTNLEISQYGTDMLDHAYMPQ
jgi:DNA-directed RNA polymerase subunit RPC12/RpoP